MQLRLLMILGCWPLRPCAEAFRGLGVNSFGTDYPLRGRRATTQYGDVNCSTRVPDHLAWIRRTIAGGPS